MVWPIKCYDIFKKPNSYFVMYIFIKPEKCYLSKAIKNGRHWKTSYQFCLKTKDMFKRYVMPSKLLCLKQNIYI